MIHWFLKMFGWYRKRYGGRWYRLRDRVTGWTEWHTEESLPVFDPYRKIVIQTESYSE